jgi:hypothetical protein
MTICIAISDLPKRLADLIAKKAAEGYRCVDGMVDRGVVRLRFEENK